MKKLIVIISALVIALSATVAFAAPMQSEDVQVDGDVHVEKVDLFVNAPTLNAYPDRKAFMLSCEPAECEFAKANITWYDSNGSPMTSDESFKADAVYSLKMQGSLSSGYFVDNDTELLVNGKPADPAKSSVSENSKDFTIAFTFPAVCGHKNTHLEGAKAATTEAPGYTGDTVCNDCYEVIARGKAIPQLPKHIDKATFSFPEIEAGGFAYGLDRCTYETDPANVIDITVCKWYRLVDAERNAWSPHTEGAFQEGETYAVEIIGSVKEGYTGDKNTELLIDGGHSRLTYGDISRRVDVTCQWTVGGGSESGGASDAGDFSGQTVTMIEASIAPPMVGESPSDGAILKSTPEEAMVLWSVEWRVWDEAVGWVRMQSGDVFEEGRIYEVFIYAGYADGYTGGGYFTELFVNGKAATESTSLAGLYFATISYEWPALTDENPNPGSGEHGATEPSDSGSGNAFPATGDSTLPFIWATFALLGSCGFALALRRIKAHGSAYGGTKLP